MSNSTTKSILYGTLASVILFGVYFAVLTLASGWKFAQDQFTTYWYFIDSLVVGFGIQVALYQYIKSFVHSGQGMGKVVGISGTTSTVAMISCCAHYLVNLVPIIGLTGLVTFVAQYQVKLFWVGIFFNIAGIVYMMSKVIKLKKIASHL